MTANQFRVTLIRAFFKYMVVFAVSCGCSTNSYKQVGKRIYLLFYYL